MPGIRDAASMAGRKMRPDELLKAAAAAAEEPTPERGRTVLVVDDDVDAADCLAAIFVKMGWRAYVAYEGKKAVAAALASRPDVVLCDLVLPGLNGFQVAQAIRQAALGGIVLIAISGCTEDEDAVKAVGAGFDHFVAKPVSLEKLLYLLGISQELSAAGVSASPQIAPNPSPRLS